MKKLVSITTTILLLISSYAYAESIKTESKIQSASKKKQQLKLPIVGELAPEIALNNIKGEDFSLTAQKGKIVVLEWTNPECPFVKKHYDSGNMQALQKKYTEILNEKKENEVVWVSIISSARGKQGFQSSKEEAQRTFKDIKSHSSQIILDEQGIVGKTYGAKTTPHMFVVDRVGKLAYAGAIDSIASADSNDIKKSENYVAKAVDELLANKKVSIANTDSYGCSVKY